MANLKVKVVDAEGNVLSGVAVTAGTISGTTGTDGIATLTGFVSGTAVAITTVLDGYTNGTGNATPVDASVVEADITMAADTSAEVKTAAATIVATVAESEWTTLKAKIQAKINSTHSWTKAMWIMILALSEAGVSWAKSYAETNA